MLGEVLIILVYNKNRDLYMFYSFEGIEVCYGKIIFSEFLCCRCIKICDEE